MLYFNQEDFFNNKIKLSIRGLSMRIKESIIKYILCILEQVLDLPLFSRSVMSISRASNSKGTRFKSS